MNSFRVNREFWSEKITSKFRRQISAYICSKKQVKWNLFSTKSSHRFLLLEYYLWTCTLIPVSEGKGEKKITLVNFWTSKLIKYSFFSLESSKCQSKFEAQKNQKKRKRRIQKVNKYYLFGAKCNGICVPFTGTVIKFVFVFDFWRRPLLSCVFAVPVRTTDMIVFHTFNPLRELLFQCVCC